MKQLKITALIISTLLITACSSTSEQRIAKQELVNQQQNALVTRAETLVFALKERLTKAKQDKLDYFASKQMENAREEYSDAMDDFDDISIDKTEASEKVVGRIAEAAQQSNMAIDAAYRIKENTQTILAESFSIQTRLQELGAPSIKSFSRAYRSISETIDDIVEEVADGDLEDAREENAELLPKLRALEVNVVKHIELKEVRSRFNALKKARAERYIPNSNNLVLATLRAAEATIASDPRNQMQIAQAVAKVKFQAQHARHLLQAVQELSKLETKDAEPYLSKYENQLHNIALSAGLSDVRNLSLQAQFETINTQVSNISAELNEYKNNIKDKTLEINTSLKQEQTKATSLQHLLSSTQQQLKQQEQTNLELLRRVEQLDKLRLKQENKILKLESLKQEPESSEK